MYNSKAPIPEILLPTASYSSDCERAGESIIELQALDLSYDIQSISSNDSDSITVIDTASNCKKLTQVREAANVTDKNSETTTCLSVVVERDGSVGSDIFESNKKDEDKQAHSGIVLSPLQLGQ